MRLQSMFVEKVLVLQINKPVSKNGYLSRLWSSLTFISHINSTKRKRKTTFLLENNQKQ